MGTGQGTRGDSLRPSGECGVPFRQTRQWVLNKVDESLARGLSKSLRIPLAVARALAFRGVPSLEKASEFLNPQLKSLSDPLQIPGMSEAADRILLALQREESVLVYGDYDADGLTATAILVLFLRECGGDVSAFLPNRHTDGYGLTVTGLRRCLLEAGAEPDLIITVDCGTNSKDAASFLVAQGIDLIVTDHHGVTDPVQHPALLVNPGLSGGPPMDSLAGCGVAFKLCHAMVKKARKDGLGRIAEIDLRSMLDLVAIGTVADVVPLTDENRILVRCGLDRINRESGCRLGVRALLDVARAPHTVDSQHLAFLVAPRLNAAGRLGDARPALDLLLCGDPGAVVASAEALEQMNRKRREVEESVLAQAISQTEPHFDGSRVLGIVQFGRDWHTGVLGIVAAKLASRYYRPCCLIGTDSAGNGRGSCRGIPGVDIMGILEECGECLTGFGGHAGAAGLTISEQQVDVFRRKFSEACERRMRGVDLCPIERIDDWIDPSQVSEIFEASRGLEPYGQMNPAPVWAVSNVSLLGAPRVVGAGHLRLVVRSSRGPIQAIAFGYAGRSLPASPIDMTFVLEEDRFGGRSDIRLKVREIRPADHTAPGPGEPSTV